MQRVIYNNLLTLIREVDLSKFKVIILSGLPGSGKSTLGEFLRETWKFVYLSSDQARVEILKLTKGKFASTSEYIKNKEAVYDYMRAEAKKLLKNNKRVVLDATNLNEQREKNIEYCRNLGLKIKEALLIYVDAGKKDRIKARFINRKGKNADGRAWVEAWETAYDYFVKQLESKIITIPENEEGGYKVVWVLNR